MDKNRIVIPTSLDHVSEAFMRKRGPIFPPPDHPPSVDFVPPEGTPPSLLAEWRNEQLREMQKASEASSRSFKVALASAVIAGVSLLVSIVTIVLSIADIL